MHALSRVVPMSLVELVTRRMAKGFRES
jgi:hypothetical protein